MTRKTLRLSADDTGLIRAHAAESYPDECCGMILGIPGDPARNRVVRIKNIQQDLHASDPAAYPRDAKRAYYMDPAQFHDATLQARNDNLEIVAFYHSHPETHAYFSDEDLKLALVWDEPAYPHAAYLVISVIAGEVMEIALFEWDAGKRNFVRHEEDIK